MKRALRRYALTLLVISVVVEISACATAPSIEGGIGGTGNVPVCKDQKQPDGKRTGDTEKCKRRNEMLR